MPDYLARAVPRIRSRRAVAVKNHPRRVVVLDGCVQRSTTPEVNAALARVLDAAHVKVVRAAGEGCCGSLELHLGQEQRAHATMRANVDALYEAAADAEAIISTASGCGVTVKDYGRLLADDPLYADRARSISAAHVRCIGISRANRSAAVRRATRQPPSRGIRRARCSTASV